MLKAFQIWYKGMECFCVPLIAFYSIYLPQWNSSISQITKINQPTKFGLLLP